MGYLKFLLYLARCQDGKLADRKLFQRNTCLEIKQEPWCIGLFNPKLYYNFQFQSCEIKEQIFLVSFCWSLDSVFTPYK